MPPHFGDRSAERPLLPRDDAVARFKVRELCQIVASGIQPVQNLRVLQKHGAWGAGGRAAGGSALTGERAGLEHKVEWGQWAINHGFKALEAALSRTAGTYCYGDAVTMADLCLVPQIYNAARFKVDMAPFPTIARVGAALAELPEFKAAHPDAQPDAQPQ